MRHPFRQDLQCRCAAHALSLGTLPIVVYAQIWLAKA